MTAAVLARRRFEMADQTAFAEMSGDWNPIHVDPVAARRLIAGAAIVHGIHALLWAIESYFAQGGKAIAGIQASFLQPIRLGNEVVVSRERNDGGDVLNVSNSAGDVMILARLTAGYSTELSGFASDACAAKAAPLNLAFDDLRDRSGKLVIHDAGRLGEVFPQARRRMSMTRLAGLAALSRLVGMECPGLHSLFMGLDLAFTRDTSASIAYRVTRLANANVPIGLAVTGAGLEGKVDAIFRPAPVAQNSMGEIEGVERGEFSGQLALVVGGSRGLGEVTAKIIALGGGMPIVTYYSGAEDATAVVDDIRRHGAQVDVIRLDIMDMAPALAELQKRGYVPTHMYYFAAPRIVANKGSFSDGLCRAFCAYFVDGFTALCERLAERRPLRAFYPSTAFIDEKVAGMAEYAEAKRFGEIAARQIERRLPRISVVARRLPRLRTDQTVSLLRRPAENPVTRLIEIVRDMHKVEVST